MNISYCFEVDTTDRNVTVRAEAQVSPPSHFPRLPYPLITWRHRRDATPQRGR